MTPIDLRLLRIFDEIYKCRSVTEAGEKIGLSQPSISIALGRLRRHFDDPLFVRTSAGMAATPRADALVVPVREALGLIDSALGQPAVFDPLRSDRTFRISMTDISVTVLLPTLLDYLSTHAPQVRIGIAILEQQKVHRAIALWVPSFLGIGDIVASTDLLATVPRLLADVLSKDRQIKVFEPPIRLPSYSVKQHWHQRFHHDRGNQWLRSVIADLFLEVSGRIRFVPGRKRRSA